MQLFIMLEILRDEAIIGFLNDSRPELSFYIIKKIPITQWLKWIYVGLDTARDWVVKNEYVTWKWVTLEDFATLICHIYCI
jgi:hypothetical protein